MRRIRVLHSLDEKRADKSLLAMQVLDTDYGKSEIVAFLSVDGLFDLRRPRDESVASLVEDLQAVEGGLEGKVIGFASVYSNPDLDRGQGCCRLQESYSSASL